MKILSEKQLRKIVEDAAVSRPSEGGGESTAIRLRFSGGMGLPPDWDWQFGHLHLVDAKAAPADESCGMCGNGIDIGYRITDSAWREKHPECVCMRCFCGNRSHPYFRRRTIEWDSCTECGGRMDLFMLDNAAWKAAMGERDYDGFAPCMPCADSIMRESGACVGESLQFVDLGTAHTSYPEDFQLIYRPA